MRGDHGQGARQTRVRCPLTGQSSHCKQHPLRFVLNLPSCPGLFQSGRRTLHNVKYFLHSVTLKILTYPVHSNITCISCKFSITKPEAISANCDFIVFTAELLQYSTESHEIKLLLKTRQKSKPTQNCCMAATASSIPRAVRTETLNQSSIPWFLVAFCKAKLTWFAGNTKHSTNGWDNTRQGCLRRVHLVTADPPACLSYGKWVWEFNITGFTQCPFLVSILSTLLGLIISKKEALPPTLGTVEETLEN